jgi:hypothetical protein
MFTVILGSIEVLLPFFSAEFLEENYLSKMMFRAEKMLEG